MGTFSIWHWLILLAVVALVFGGRGKLSGIMGDAAKGIRAFREGLKGEDEEAKVEPEPEPAKPLPKPRARAATAAKPKTATKSAAKPRAKTKVSG